MLAGPAMVFATRAARVFAFLISGRLIRGAGIVAV